MTRPSRLDQRLFVRHLLRDGGPIPRSCPTLEFYLRQDSAELIEVKPRRHGRRIN